VELNLLVCAELMILMIFIALSIMNAKERKKKFYIEGYLMRTTRSAIPTADLCSRLITAKFNQA
jgi:hypothetical protein